MNGRGLLLRPPVLGEGTTMTKLSFVAMLSALVWAGACATTKGEPAKPEIPIEVPAGSRADITLEPVEDERPKPVMSVYADAATGFYTGTATYRASITGLGASAEFKLAGPFSAQVSLGWLGQFGNLGGVTGAYARLGGRWYVDRATSLGLAYVGRLGSPPWQTPLLGNSGEASVAWSFAERARATAAANVGMTTLQRERRDGGMALEDGLAFDFMVGGQFLLW